MALKTINDEYLSAIGSAIRSKNGTENTYKPKDMAAAILDITTGGGTGGDIEIPVITGDCSYRFAYNGWNWAVEAFGDQMETADITDCRYMFAYSKTLKEIPFEINCKEGTKIPLQYLFSQCHELKDIPKINNCIPSEANHMFSQCYKLREIPENIETWFDWSYIEGLTSGYSGSRAATFENCHSLRSFPMSFLEHENPKATYSYSIYSGGFDNCFALDEIIDLPINGGHVLNATTSNLFSNTFRKCSRLKNITFKSYATDTVAVRPVKWKSQVIDLSQYVGYVGYDYYVTDYNSGITADKKVTDDATYQALKNDPDWWTRNVSYSRYNHDSAVATINSLPDTSSYLASSGGTNTIKFLGQSGELTDGGAINTLTEEEIAVATARGWTVSLV